MLKEADIVDTMRRHADFLPPVVEDKSDVIFRTKVMKGKVILDLYSS